MITLAKTHKLILYNDDEHSFEYVAACLIKLCKHDMHQALQCATIVDGRGKYDVKYGGFDEVLEMQFGLKELGLIVEIEENESTLY
jgi:ATP-dependent Clp protease adaptor protein ClpS